MWPVCSAYPAELCALLMGIPSDAQDYYLTDFSQTGFYIETEGENKAPPSIRACLRCRNQLPKWSCPPWCSSCPWFLQAACSHGLVGLELSAQLPSELARSPGGPWLVRLPRGCLKPPIHCSGATGVQQSWWLHI